MIGTPDFSSADLAEARRLNRRLARLPRLRMQTPIGRVALNALLRLVEIYPLLQRRKRGVRAELRVIEACGQRVKLRIFRPNGPVSGVVLDLHGGGWTIGNARMADGQNGKLALRLNVAVVSVDYKLALAGPIEASIVECATAMSWIAAHAQREFGTPKIIVKGSSAGAHLAACAVTRLRAHDEVMRRIAGVMLYFGLYDFSATPMVRAAKADTLILHAPTVRATLSKLTPDMNDEERRGASISPVYGDLTGLPPALFVVGEKDILLEDNQRMAARWQAANGNARLLVVPESPHAFIMMNTAIARKVEKFVDTWILDRLANPASPGNPSFPRPAEPAETNDEPVAGA